MAIDPAVLREALDKRAALLDALASGSVQRVLDLMAEGSDASLKVAYHSLLTIKQALRDNAVLLRSVDVGHQDAEPETPPIRPPHGQL